MNLAVADEIAKAVLYEGYILYPYRPSSVKNRQRWTFGGVYPRAYCEQAGACESDHVLTECLVLGDGSTRLEVRVRFLHLIERRENGRAWQEAVEREVRLPTVGLRELEREPIARAFEFGDADLAPRPGASRRQERVTGEVVVSASRLAGPPASRAPRAPRAPNAHRISVRITNLSAFAGEQPARDAPADEARAARDEALLRALASTHAVLGLEGGSFVSLMDPPAALAAEAARCANVGAYPVLVGEPGSSETMLASPIVLYDYPEIAPESPGDLFDGCEIDEILTLRILTMTDDEKREMVANDSRAQALLDRTERLTQDDLMKMHGTIRALRPSATPASRGDDAMRHETPSAPDPFGDLFPTFLTSSEGHEVTTRAPVTSVLVRGVLVAKGSRVILRPRPRGDVLDLALAGMTAVVAGVEQDFEDRVFVAVLVDEDPGKDLGESGKAGHKFFFHADEVEPIS